MRWPRRGEIWQVEVLSEVLGPESAVLAELQALREDIKALRADLQPVPSLIFTGREVLDEFKRLRA